MITVLDRWLTKISSIVALGLEAREDRGNAMEKRGREKGYSQYLTDVDPRTKERELVNDRTVPLYSRERKIMEMKNELASIETGLSSGTIQDKNAAKARADILKLRIALMTTPANFWTLR
jgi:hypothetical protein